jgi:RimJ/RimL family protein N-acetyltransferase
MVERSDAMPRWLRGAGRLFQKTSFNVFRLGRNDRIGPSQMKLEFAGINRLAQSGDATMPELAEPYRGFAARGDDGVVALADGKTIGWAWVRHGPFREPAGVGIASFPSDVSVVQFFEVNTVDRGRGYGVEILRELTRRLIATANSNPVIALVGVDNISSEKCFTRCGYTKAGKLTTRRVLGSPVASRVR